MRPYAPLCPSTTGKAAEEAEQPSTYKGTQYARSGSANCSQGGSDPGEPIRGASARMEPCACKSPRLKYKRVLLKDATFVRNGAVICPEAVQKQGRCRSCHSVSLYQSNYKEPALSCTCTPSMEKGQGSDRLSRCSYLLAGAVAVFPAGTCRSNIVHKPHNYLYP